MAGDVQSIVGVWKFSLVYWGLTRQQQPGSYRGGDDDDGMSVSLVEETGVPGGNPVWMLA